MGGTAWVVPFLFFGKKIERLIRGPHPHVRSGIKEEHLKFM